MGDDRDRPLAGSFPVGLPALDDEHAPMFSVGQVASMLEVREAFLRRVDAQHIVSPRRSAGGQRRYSRDDIGRLQEVVSMMGEGMTLPAIRRIIELQHELDRLRRQRDELAARLRESPTRSEAPTRGETPSPSEAPGRSETPARSETPSQSRPQTD